MKLIKHLLAFLIFLMATSMTYSQEDQNNTPKPSLDNGTIESQFDYLYRKSSSYQEYKVVKQTFYYKIKKNVLDSLKVLKNELASTKQVVAAQEIEVNELKDDLKTTNDNLTSVTKEKDNIKLLGISLTKASYNTILWSIITGLVLFLLFFIFKFKNSNTVTKQANKSLAEIEEEFFAFKTVSLEREQKVRRELQDEINKTSSKGKK
jgi:uncharacterized integral membrane protein